MRHVLIVSLFAVCIGIGCKNNGRPTNSNTIDTNPPGEQSVLRKALAEGFTSATCPPCRGANETFNTWLEGFGHSDRIIVVKYHVWWPSPGNDPFYLANPDEVRSRNTFYGNNYAPHMYVDGYLDAGSNPLQWSNSLMSRLDSAPAVEISMTGQRSGLGGTVNVRVKTTSGSTIATQLTLFVLVTETGLEYVGTNGEIHHNYVFRKFVTAVDGSSFSLGQNTEWDQSLSFTLDASWVLENCSFVAFVQGGSESEVLQAERISVSSLTSG